MSNPLMEARETLTSGGDLVALAEAIGTIISDPSSTLDDIRLGLLHGGLVAEQARLELRRREKAVGSAAQADPVALPGKELAGEPHVDVG